MNGQEIPSIMELVAFMHMPYSPFELYMNECYSMPVINQENGRWYYRFFAYLSHYDRDHVYVRPVKTLTVNMADFNDYIVEAMPIKEYKIAVNWDLQERMHMTYEEMLLHFEVIKNLYMKGKMVDQGLVRFFAKLFKEYVGEEILPCYYSLSQKYMTWIYMDSE